MKTKLFYVIITIACCFIFNKAIFADVIFLNDGSIFIGSISDGVNGKKTINSFGKNKEISGNDIVKIEKDMNNLKNIGVIVKLRDNSTYEGRIIKEDAGSLIMSLRSNSEKKIDTKDILNINFNHKSIGVHNNDYYGTSHNVGSSELNDMYLGLTVGGHIPFSKNSGEYKNSYNASLLAEYFPDFFEESRIGFDLRYFFIKSETSSDLSYKMFSFQPYVLYPFYDFDHSAVVFAAGGIGVNYIIVNKADDTKKSNVFNLESSVYFGVDMQLSESLFFRPFAGLIVVPQNDGFYSNLSANIGLLYRI